MKSKINIENYEIISKIGEGGFGIVYKARQSGTKKIVAIKQIKNISGNNEQYIQLVAREMKISETLNGLPNILNLVDIQKNNLNNFCFIYDYYEYDMNDLIYRERLTSLKQIKSYFRQMIIGLNSLHSKKYIHNDVKPMNFLISYNNDVKIADFGLSEEIKNLRHNIGTIGYSAPEKILGEMKYGPEVDVWSLGCTLYEMLVKEQLFQKCYTFEQYAYQYVQIFGIPSRKEWPEFYSFPNVNMFLKYQKKSSVSFKEFLNIKIAKKFKKFKPLLIKMMSPQPHKRISLADILDDSFIKDSETIEKLPKLFINETKNFEKIKDKKTNKIKIAYDKMMPKKIVPKNILEIDI